MATRGASVFVRVRGPTTDGTVWRAGPHHALAVVSYFARKWGAVAHCRFARVRRARLY